MDSHFVRSHPIFVSSVSRSFNSVIKRFNIICEERRLLYSFLFFEIHRLYFFAFRLLIAKRA